MKEMTFTIFVFYNDDSDFHFDVTIEGTPVEVEANLMMITRGTLMASSGHRAICYNSDGNDVCSYIR